MVKISFRSVGDFDVNQFARTYFSEVDIKMLLGEKATLNGRNLKVP